MATSQTTRPRAVGNYQLGDRLGEGTFGTVLKGTHSIASERVAIKVLESQELEDDELFDALRMEIGLLRQVGAPARPPRPPPPPPALTEGFAWRATVGDTSPLAL